MRLEFDRVLSVRICIVDSSIDISQSLGYPKSVEWDHFYILLASSLTDI